MICYQRVDAGPGQTEKKNNPLWFPAKVNGLAELQSKALSESRVFGTGPEPAKNEQSMPVDYHLWSSGNSLADESS